MDNSTEKRQSQVDSEIGTEERNQVKTPSVSKQSSAPAPRILRYIMLGLLALSVGAGSIFAFVHQNSAIPSATDIANQSCTDPVEENRLRQALRQNSNDFVTLMDWGTYNQDCKKDYPAAISAFELSVNVANTSPDKVSVDDRHVAYVSLGTAYLQTQRLKQAEQAFRTVLSEDQNNVSALIWLGTTLYLSDPPQAVPYLEKVLTLSPNTEASKLAQTMIDDIKQGKVRVKPTPTATK
ncbi:MAG: hypothetical protein HXX08_24325 [Chloroflexi bacterium]|uniref:Tetratricopeptide repeat protein n=1 Tax=Candidatus Chlorohelix allophototropha TaxID=3003348 RepID=A0A8T7MA29_9CHLR|nr:hypothetical protein [Chloroflexota bacterium]WJW68929.1 hypothetical protein OZ401_004551 [Chloroflexota bacterium L227-S17]